MDITLRMSDHALTARAAAAAGIVLLQNKNRTLPLLPQEDGAPLPVAVFGVKQLQTPAFDKTMTPWRSIGVLDGLAASETVRPDALLARKYRTWAVEHPEGSEMPLTNLDFGALRHDCAAAVVVIGRTPERYGLRLTDEETAMLTRVTSVFDRTAGGAGLYRAERGRALLRRDRLPRPCRAGGGRGACRRADGEGHAVRPSFLQLARARGGVCGRLRRSGSVYRLPLF